MATNQTHEMLIELNFAKKFDRATNSNWNSHSQSTSVDVPFGAMHSCSDLNGSVITFFRPEPMSVTKRDSWMMQSV